MKLIAAFQSELKLSLKDIAEFKFTRGSWDKDAWIKLANGRSNLNNIIRPKEGEIYSFEIETYSDRMND